MEKLPDKLQRASDLLGEAGALISESLGAQPKCDPYAAQAYAEAAELAQRSRTLINKAFHYVDDLERAATRIHRA